jgi:hypothetical protein
MNDFAEIENELRKLRPAQPSPVLFDRIEEVMSGGSKAARPAHVRWGWRRFIQTPYNWGFAAAAAAAVLVLLALVHMQRDREAEQPLAQSQAETRTTPLGRSNKSPLSDRFVPAGETRLVYNTRDEGLQFARGSGQPLRRVRYQTHETWQWRNPTTGASLRVSYPSEEVVLIPVSGQ